MVMVMMMANASAHRLCQILDVRKVAARRGIAEVRREGVELRRRRGIAVCRGSLGGGLQVRRNLLRDLLIFGRVRLLELLELGHQLGEG